MSDPTPDSTPTAQAQHWLNRFDQALQRRDLDAAVAFLGLVLAHPQ